VNDYGIAGISSSVTAGIVTDQPAENFMQSLYRFVEYKYYWYGYPFFLYSALSAILPLKLLFGQGSTSQDMLMLRQMMSVLPMLLSLGLLAYMQTKFQKLGRSILTFVFLLFVPIVLENNLWWHPESLVLLFVVLTLFFLQRDNLAFGWNFYLAAIACGLAVATKLMGLFFFLAVPVYIFMGWKQGRINLRQVMQVAGLFVTLMSLTFLLSNPFLFFESERQEALKIHLNHPVVTSSGWIFVQDTGLGAWMPVLRSYYGQAAFLVIAWLAVILGALRGERRLVNLMILFWSLPFALYLIFIVALKHKYYPIAVLLPVFSALPNLLDWIPSGAIKRTTGLILQWLALTVAFVILVNQAYFNLKYSVDFYRDSFHKDANSDALAFFSIIEPEYLSRLAVDRKLTILRDVQVYISDDPRWDVKHRWGMIHYGYIERLQPDVIVLWKQQVHDYTNADMAGRVVHPEVYAEALPFYQDALHEQIDGYKLLYENDFGMFFLSDPLVAEVIRDP